MGVMALWNNSGLPILALCAGYDVGVRQLKSNLLKAVANAEDRSVREFEESRVEMGSIFFVYGERATGKDDAFGLEAESI